VTCDAWLLLLFNTVTGVASFCTPFIGAWVLSLLFKDTTKKITGFIAEAMKSEFTTDVGKINLIGLFIILIVLIIPSNGDDTSASTKGFIVGFFLLGSLIITYFHSKKHKAAVNKDDSNASKS